MKHLDQGTLLAVEGWQSVPLPLADLHLWRGWLTDLEAKTLYDGLASQLHWQQPSLKIAGKLYPIPRLQAWYGDADAVYRYSGTRFAPLGWTAELDALRRRLEDVCGASFNSVLANWYRHGAEGMGFHADDEPELGPQPVIASVSLGGSRRFVLKPRRGLEAEPLSIELGNGDLLKMSGATQRHWHHGIPKTRKPVLPRINLTFRLIQPL